MKDLEDFTIGTIKLNEVTHKPNNVETDYQYEIDLKKGILWQVWNKLNKEEYLAFIHDPKHMINPPEAILFETKFLELFTKTPWWAIPIIWLPLVIYNFYTSFFEIALPAYLIVALFFIGILVWTISEYVLHRFVFHVDDNIPDSKTLRMLHFLLHGIHHAFPMDKNRLVFPPVAAYPLFKLIKYCIASCFGYYHTAVLAGTITGYIMYDLSHYYIHHAKPANSYHKELKSYHVLHHYKNPHLGYGVSNKLWDYVFSTVLVDDKKEKSS
jgi:4-hydroxysphinganine ceramide fatty acyl 2-hydroxylase